MNRPAETFDLEAYMDRRCVCGTLRKEHAHMIVGGQLSVRAVGNLQCTGFTDEIEKQLGGSPWHNPLLRPLIERQLQAEPMPLDFEQPEWHPAG